MAHKSRVPIALVSGCFLLSGVAALMRGQNQAPGAAPADALSKEEHLRIAKEAETKFHAAVDGWQAASSREQEAKAIEGLIVQNLNLFPYHILRAGGIPNAATFTPGPYIFAGPIKDARGDIHSLVIGGGPSVLKSWIWPRKPQRFGDDGGFGFSFSISGIDANSARFGHAVVVHVEKKTTFYIPYALGAHVGIVDISYDGNDWTFVPDVGTVERHRDGQDNWIFEAVPATRPTGDR